MYEQRQGVAICIFVLKFPLRVQHIQTAALKAGFVAGYLQCFPTYFLPIDIITDILIYYTLKETLIQDILFFTVSWLLGLTLTVNIIFTILISIVVSILFIALGILMGSLVSEKATGGLGSVIVQLVCFTSGMYFPKESVGKGFSVICEILPFESCLNIIKGILNNQLEIISLQNIIIFLIYTISILVLAIIVFKKKMISDNK
jgi:ABC-2 type transport system permease protein